MMKSLITLLVLLSAAFSNPCFAVGDGVIKELLVGRLGYQVFVKLEGNIGSISCRSRNDFHYYLNLNTPGSREILSTLLTARATGQNITVVTSDRCDDEGQGLEVLHYVKL